MDFFWSSSLCFRLVVPSEQPPLRAVYALICRIFFVRLVRSTDLCVLGDKGVVNLDIITTVSLEVCPRLHVIH